jgi:hypothetical protein
VKKYTDDYYILTKSGWDAKCPLGKTEWIQKHFPKELNRLWIIRGTKKYAANYNSFLIDDRKKNREEWVANGGYAFAWKENASKELANQLLTQLDDELYFAKHGKAKSV